MSVLDNLNYVMELEDNGSWTAILKILRTIPGQGPRKVQGQGQPAQFFALPAEDVDGALQVEYWNWSSPSFLVEDVWKDQSISIARAALFF